MELLNQMDGFDQNTNVKVSMASRSCCSLTLAKSISTAHVEYGLHSLAACQLGGTE
jgi:hypothetical protein